MSFSLEDLQEQLKSFVNQHVQAKAMVAHLSGAIQTVEQQIKIIADRAAAALEAEALETAKLAAQAELDKIGVPVDAGAVIDAIVEPVPTEA